MAGPALARVPVREWASQWLAGQSQLKASTRERYEGLLRRHVLPRWGSVPLASITHADVVGWVGELTASGLSASTVRHAHRVFAMLLGLAVRDGRLSRNPAERVPLPRVRRADKQFFDHDQVAELAEAADPGLTPHELRHTAASLAFSVLARTSWPCNGFPVTPPRP